MCRILICLFLLSLSSVVSAQNINNIAFNPTTSQIEFDNDNGNTAVIASGYIYKYYTNNIPVTKATVCTGTVKPWKCRTTDFQFNIGKNDIQTTVTIASVESAKSNTLIVFYAVSQKEIITNTNNVNDTNNVTNTTTVRVVKCMPGSFKVGRFTGVNAFTSALNSEQNPVVSFFATANAIYFISCITEE